MKRFVLAALLLFALGSQADAQVFPRRYGSAYYYSPNASVVVSSGYGYVPGYSSGVITAGYYNTPAWNYYPTYSNYYPTYSTGYYYPGYSYTNAYIGPRYGWYGRRVRW